MKGGNEAKNSASWHLSNELNNDFKVTPSIGFFFKLQYASIIFSFNVSIISF